MWKRHCVLASPIVLIAVLGAPARELQLKDRDHQGLGKLIGAYFEAKRESSGIAVALAKLDEEVGKIDKKSKDLPFLAMVDDIQKSMYYSAKYKDSVTKGRLDDVSMKGKFGDVRYSLHAPKSYKASKGPYPLVICLPDVDQTVQQHFEASWADPAMREAAIFAICQLPEDKTKWTIMEGGIAVAMQVLAAVRKEYAVDIDRTYVFALGAGIPVAMAIGQNYPHVFAGVIGRAGDIAEGIAPTNFRNLPTLLIETGSNSAAFEKAAIEAGIASCTRMPDAAEADVRKWIDEHPRTAHPMRITLAPTTQFGKSGYWLTVDDFDPTDLPSVDATADRTANTINVLASEIGSLRVYFNDVLVDMSKPIRVTLNGQEREISVPRSLEHTLDQAYISSDTGRVYTYSYYFEVPPHQE